MASGISRAWFIAPAALLLLGVLTWWSAKSQRTISNAFRGTHDAVVTLRVPEGEAEKIADDVVQRFVVMGVDARVLEARGDTLKLRLNRVAEPGSALLGVLSPQPLSFRDIPEAQRLDAGFAQVDAGVDVPFAIGTSRAEVLASIERAQLRPGGNAVLECMPPQQKGAPTMCAAWLVGEDARIRRAHIQSVDLAADPRTEEPLVKITFTEEGARAFEAFSRAHVGERIAVIALGELQARPRIEAPVTDGVWSISTRTGDTGRSEAVARAQRIDAALELAPLPPLEVQQVEELP